jgi:transcriptional regulator with XRE-family HTH domain
MDENAVKSKVGAVMRARRTELGFSQDTFADEIGMHRAYYSSLERGERNLTLQTLMRVAKGLKTKASELLKGAGV